MHIYEHNMTCEMLYINLNGYSPLMVGSCFMISEPNITNSRYPTAMVMAESKPARGQSYCGDGVVMVWWLL
jgi:hypothetical protein